MDGGGSRSSYVVEMTKENSSAAWTSAVVLSVSKSSETLVGDPAAIQNIGTDVNTIFIRNSANKMYELRWDFATSKYIKKTVSL